MHLLTIVQKRPKYNLLMVMIKILFSLVSVRALIPCDLGSLRMVLTLPGLLARTFELAP